MIMNNIYKILFSAAAGLAVFASCVKETYQAGEPEVDNYGVYFETLTSAQKSVEFDPAEEAVMTFTAYRAEAKADDAITVPVKLTATYETKDGQESADGVFSVSEISFEEGQAETVFEVSFPDAKLGTKYECTIECVDTKYTGIYTDKPLSISFDVTRVKWNRLVGKDGEEYGTWTDDIIAPAFGTPNYTNDKVEMYEREDKPGYYRMKDAYGSRMVRLLFGGDGSDEDYLEYTTPGTYTYVDATNPDKVYILWGASGTTLGSDGEIWFGSFCGENGFKGKSYGTMSNGVIKFPKNGIVIGFDDEPYNYMNSEKNTIVLPGYKDFDYSVQAVAGQSEDGKLPVKVVLGADVVTAKYAVYEGAVPSGDVSVKALEISRDEAAKTITESSVIEIECEETGVYTVVFATMDKEENLKSSAAARFSYVKAGDTVPVVVSAGIGSAERYVGQGYNTDNTVEVWCYGKDLVSVKIGVVKYTSWFSSPEDCVKEVNSKDAVSAEVLEQINGDGYAAPVPKLLPGTGYKVVVIASNGYETKVLVPDAVVTTTGKPLPIYDSYTIDSIDEELLPEKSEGYFGKYNFYAVDAYGELGMREYISKVTVSDSDIPDSEPDKNGLVDEYVEISGLFAASAKNYGFDDTMTWDFYGGVLYSLNQQFGQGGKYWFSPMIFNGKSVYSGNGLLLGGYVKDGYIAFVCPSDYSEKYGFSGVANAAFGDEKYSEYIGLTEAYNDLLLVEESKDDNGLAPGNDEVQASIQKLNAISRFAGNMPVNCVETAKGHMRTVIDGFKAQKKIRTFAPEHGIFGTAPTRKAGFTSSVGQGADFALGLGGRSFSVNVHRTDVSRISEK